MLTNRTQPDPDIILRNARENHAAQLRQLGEKEARAQACQDPARRAVLLRAVELERSVVADSAKVLSRARDKHARGSGRLEVRRAH